MPSKAIACRTSGIGSPGELTEHGCPPLQAPAISFQIQGHGLNLDLHDQSLVVFRLYLISLPAYQKDHCRVVLDLFSSSGSCWDQAWGWTSALVFQ